MSPRDVESREKVISHIARTEAQLWLRPNEVSFPEVVSQQSSLYGISEQNAEAASIAILHGLRAHKKKDVGQYIAAINYYECLEEDGCHWIPVSSAAFAEVRWWQKHDKLTQKVREVVDPGKDQFLSSHYFSTEGLELKDSLAELFVLTTGLRPGDPLVNRLAATKYQAILLYTKIKYYKGAPEYLQRDFTDDKHAMEALLIEHYKLLHDTIEAKRLQRKAVKDSI